MTTELRSVPRAPGRLPLLGHIIPLARRPFGFLGGLRDVGEIVRVDLGTSPTYFLTTSDVIHELIVLKPRSFEKGRLIDRAREFTGNGLLNSDNATNMRRRRLVQPMLHRARVREYSAAMVRHAEELADSFEAGGEVDMHLAMYEYTINTVTTSLFSSHADTASIDVIRHQVPFLLKGVMARAALPALLGRIPVRFNREFDRAVTDLREVIDHLVAGARKDPDDSPDILSTLIAARDAETGEALSDEEVRDELVTILIGGTDTTASTLAWTFHELAHSPETEARVLAEVDAVLGDGPIGFENIPHLTYINNVVTEVARLHAIPVLMRRSVEDVELGGVRIPAGTELAFSPYSIHRDPRLYAEPDRFLPERWESGGSRAHTGTEFIAFSTGLRKCPGEAYARMEMPIAIATILSRWRLRPASDRPVGEVLAAVPRPSGLVMTPVRRERAGVGRDGGAKAESETRVETETGDLLPEAGRRSG
ncbi:cytochrome P450 [Yinghuangia sp. YIM S09857]|uniref:cytochrome P450 n=1 Tax=Yinghuangia sp. YIM S09857 TaxID=3436929 RepID=UPI003F53862A